MNNKEGKIYKIKLDKVFIKDEMKITSKKDGKTYDICPVAIHDNEDFAGKWINGSFFSYKDEKNPANSKTATQRAEQFRSYNEGRTTLLRITEREYTSKDGEQKTALDFKVLSKKERETAAQFIKIDDEPVEKIKNQDNLDEF